MEPHARRPSPAQYRNAYRALMLALRALFADALAARRAVRTTLDGGGLKFALLALRTAPETFGTARPVADPRVRELADEALTTFALCRAACTRPLIREGADLLRPGLVEQAAERERKAASEAAYNAWKAVDDATNLRKTFDWNADRFREEAARVYWNPDAAVKAALNFGQVHGHSVFWTESHKHPMRFGWMRWGPFVAHWRGRFRLKVREYEGMPLVHFRTYGSRLVQMWDQYKRTRMDELQAAAASTAATVAALGPDTPWSEKGKAPERASGPIHDALRLISPRRPDDAVPEVRRQLAAMLPADAEPLIDRAIQSAQKQLRDDDRRAALLHRIGL